MARRMSAFALIAALGIASVEGGACGSSGAGRSLPATTLTIPATSVPPDTAPPTNPPGTTVAPGCPATAADTDHHRAGAVLSAAALLSATVTVDAQPAPAPACNQLHPGDRATLHVGDRLQFVANSAPELRPATPPVLSVSTEPVPAPPAPPGQLSTAHVLVTLTAVAAGTVRLTWEDCSGTGC